MILCEAWNQVYGEEYAVFKHNLFEDKTIICNDLPFARFLLNLEKFGKKPLRIILVYGSFLCRMNLVKNLLKLF